MSAPGVNLADEIVQDFLVEAGELLDQLGEQLVDLEVRADDGELLNAIFRGFHTIKGGAGFLSLVHLVEVCHRAEDVFNLLRRGERRVDPALVDAVLKALDTVNEMFRTVRGGELPGPAPQDVLEALGAVLAGEANPLGVPMPPTLPAPAAPVEQPAAPPSGEPVIAPSAGAPTEGGEEVELLSAMLEAIGGAAPPQGLAVAAAGDASAPDKGTEAGEAPADEISDDEFEALLDQLHGPGRHGGLPPGAEPPPSAPPVAPAPAKPVEPPLAAVAVAERPALERPAPDPVPPRPAPSTAPAAPAAGAAQQGGAHPGQGESTVRVDTEVLDHIMNMVGELVLARNRLVALVSAKADEEMAKAVGNLDVVTADLQAGVMRTRMQPIRRVFGRFPRVVRDLARSLGKEINLELSGEDTDLDKNLVEALADPLVHLVRNAVDHGIEPPEVRERAGKPRKGTVLLAAEQEGDHILLSISDDGAGMDAEVLRRKAVEKGVLEPEAAARLDPRECYNLIFLPGFSTKSVISDVSGRGVGMDVVKTRISQLNGSVDVDSTHGHGTTIRIKVPLTLAIVPTLMVMLGRQIFALPLVNVSEIFDLAEGQTHTVDGQLVVQVRNRPLPLFYLKQWTSLGRGQGLPATDGTHVVVVQVGTQHVGFVVDQLLGQEEVVIKPLGTLLHGLPGLAGATITGDGRIALILDVPSLVRSQPRTRPRLLARAV
jgi:two-component system chemotaxis sensor kinase CheA